jgi:hypothetical protein
MSNEMQVIKASDYGVDTAQEKDLMSNLPTIKAERDLLVPHYEEVIIMDIDSPITASKAREVRVLIQKNRTLGINQWHKTSKDYFLKGGQFVDAIKRRESNVNERMEAALSEIEKHAEIMEAKRIKAIQEEREAELSKYVDDISLINLSGMEDEVWGAFLSKKKTDFEFQQSEIKRIEEEREAQIESDRLERVRIEEENKALKIEADKRELLEKTRIVKESKEAKVRADKLKKEREAHEALLVNERLKADKESKEAKAREDKLIEAANNAAKLKEKELADKEAKEQNELKKGDSDKMEDLKNSLSGLKNKYKFKAKINQKKYFDVGLLIDEVINHIR